MTRNEAAERLHEANISAAWAALRNDVLTPDGPPFPAPVADLFRAGRLNVEEAYRAALAHELQQGREEAVREIRAQFREVEYPCHECDNAPELHRILDAIASPSEEPKGTMATDWDGA